LRRLGYAVESESFFDTIVVQADAAVHQRARAAGINLRAIDNNRIGISLDETTTRETVEKLWQAFAQRALDMTVESLDGEVEEALPAGLLRRDSFLTHPVFHAYRSETEMMRYLKRLQERDIALDRSMIPLGSCTMKLNAAAEMMAI